jgi:glycosyltransferase involved in cell wall biosynthesis
MGPKNKSPQISVIIPSYNHGKYIVTAINSVLSQSFEDFELIVIDDGSKDSSPQIIQTIHDPRLIFFAQKNKGAHEAINRGLSLAKGKYLTILNSDDVFHPLRLEKCREVLENKPEVDLVSSWIEVIGKTGEVLDTKKAWHNLLPWDIEDIQHSFLHTNDYVRNLLATNFVATTSNIFMRSSVFSSIGGMRNLRFAHDWDFLLRAAAIFQCQNIEEPLLQYRVHPSNTISQNRRHMLFEILWVLASNYPSYEGKVLFKDNSSLDKDFTLLYNSLNLQYNDKIFWILRSMIESLRKQGKSEVDILNDKNLISTILNYIIE